MSPEEFKREMTKLSINSYNQGATAVLISITEMADVVGDAAAIAEMRRWLKVGVGTVLFEGGYRGDV